MNEIQGTLTLSIQAKAGETYIIRYDKAACVNICNYTDGAIFISEKNDFTFVNNVGNFLTVTDGNCYNDYMFFNRSNTIYIKADADGYICLVRKQW